MNLTINLIEERQEATVLKEARSRFDNVKSINIEAFKYDKHICKIELVLWLGKKYIKRLITIDNLELDTCDELLNYLSKIYDVVDKDELILLTIVNKLEQVTVGLVYREQPSESLTIKKRFDAPKGISILEIGDRYLDYYKTKACIDIDSMQEIRNGLARNETYDKLTYGEGNLLKLFLDRPDTDMCLFTIINSNDPISRSYLLMGLKSDTKVPRDTTIENLEFNLIAKDLVKRGIAIEADVAYHDFIENKGLIGIRINTDFNPIVYK